VLSYIPGIRRATGGADKLVRSLRFRDTVIEMLDHTADVGFELGASTLEELFDEARRALLMVVFERPPQGGADLLRVQLSAPDRETLLVRWLNELTFLIQNAGFVPADAQIRLQQTGGAGLSLRASLTGAPILLEEYGWQGEIKSATFHGLDVSNDDEGWHARVILDV
jgi:SHS2 domain-containing protein